MNKSGYYILCVFFFFFLYSCTDSKNTKSDNPVYMGILEHRAIDTGEDFVGNGGPLAIYEDAIIGVDFTLGSSIPPFYCLKPDNDSLSFYHFGSKGQGPNEFLEPNSLQRIGINTLGANAPRSRSYCEFTVPLKDEEVRIDKKVALENYSSYVIKTAFNQYIALSMMGESMFNIADSTGKTVNTFFEYPYKNNDERERYDNKVRFFAYQGSLAANPSKTRFAYSANNGDIIHFYDIENNNIRLITKVENEYPLYGNRNIPGQFGVMLNAECLKGYLGLYATDQFVYALFSGKEHNDPKCEEATTLRVFDWNGNLSKEYELDIPSLYLCVSDDDSKLWAIALDPDILLVYFDL